VTAIAWSLVGLMAGSLGVLATALFSGLNRIDALGARLDARIDGLATRIDAQGDSLAARIDAQGAELRAGIRDVRQASQLARLLQAACVDTGRATVDSPWVLMADNAKFASSYEHLRSNRPELVLSTHLPPARGQIDAFVGMLEQAPHADPWMGPDQAQLEAMLAGIPSQPASQEPVTT
jgi:hypothetical protein